MTIRYSPFDLTGIEVFHRDVSHGSAQPHIIKRHCHPKVKQAGYDGSDWPHHDGLKWPRLFVAACYGMVVSA